MCAIIKCDDNIAYNVNEYIYDSVSDLGSLARCTSGSTTIVLENDNTMMFMKNTEDKWVKL